MIVLKNTKNEKNTNELILDYILIGDQKWCQSNIGNENSVLEKWVKVNKFQECTSEQDWIDKVNSNTPAYYVIKNKPNSLGYFFNIEALKKIKNKPPNGWRIAEYEDFQELLEYVNNLKIKSINSLQLILSNAFENTRDGIL